MTLIDVFIIVIILLFGLIGTAKGFLKEIFGKASWIFSVLGGLAFYPKLSPYLKQYLKKELFCQIAAFLLIFIVIFLIIQIVHTIVDHIFSGQIFRGLDRSLGFLLGLVEGCFIVVVIITILQIQNFFDASGLFRGSFFYNIYISVFGTKPVTFGGRAA